MDSTHGSISGDMWNATWFLMAREIWPCKVGSPKEWSRSPSWLQSMNERVKWLQQEISRSPNFKGRGYLAKL
jgi:hypothetical protein